MRNLLLAAGVAALAIAAPAAADKGDKGGGHKGGHSAHTSKAERGGGKAQRPAKAERREGKVRAAKADRRETRADRKPDRREARAERRFEKAKDVRLAREDRRDRRERARERSRDRDRIARLDRRDERRSERQLKRVRDGDRLVLFDRRDDDRRRFDRRDRVPLRFAARDYGWDRNLGCPPGLDRKDNGCLPPGQAKKLVGRALPAAFAASLLPSYYRSWYPDNDDYYFRRGDDYIYRIGRDDGRIDGYMPLFDYADYDPDYYYIGERYPLDYVSFYNVPAAYQSYYPDRGDWLYRYGDGAIYQVDRSSGVVNAIVQLLAGDLSVGSQLPMGYDVYNVPYAYRDRYYDTQDHWYRYNDGYIYQVDPKTRLIQAVIQALV